MADISQVKEHMAVIGADEVRTGTVDKVEGNRIKLSKDLSPSGRHAEHHHFLSEGLIAPVEGNTVRLYANADAAIPLEEEEGEALNSSAEQAQRIEIIAAKSLWSWNKVGVGAVAVGLTAVAFAGAGLLARKNHEDDFELLAKTMKRSE